MHTLHKASDCFLNLSHLQYKEKKKEHKDNVSANNSNEKTLKMNLNLINNDDYILINPWITLTATNVQFPKNLLKNNLAIDSNFFKLSNIILIYFIFKKINN